MERINIVISTDGACSGNPGPGGWAAVLRFGDNVLEISGYDPATTNNRMELKAIIEAAKVLKKPCNVTVRTDSKYVCNNAALVREHVANGWRTKAGARCANYDMWQELLDVGLKGKHKFQCVHTKAHSGDPDNERCDFLAKEEIKAHR